MTNPLRQPDLVDDLLLGHISWYTITGPQITHDELETLVNDIGLSPSITPKAPRPGDAFKRACRYSERANIPLRGTDNTANILIRSVAQNPQEIERHMVLEEVDPDGRKLNHTDVAHLRFERQKIDTGKLHVKKQTVESKELGEIVDESIQLFISNVESASKYIDSQAIRRMIRDQLDISNAIAVRRKGSVYFLPKSSNDVITKLEEFCDHMGPGSEFFAVPMPDTTKYRDFITNAFTAEVHDESIQLITELQAKLGTNKPITAKSYADYKKRYDVLNARSAEYGSLVEDQMTAADLELKALNSNLKRFLLDDMVKS